ncbi:unnamed protein product [Cunninghamella echinulata]
MSNTDAIVNTPLTTKQPFLTFLTNDNNNSKKQTTMEQITKGFTHFSLSPRNGYKFNKDQAIVLDNENDIHRPSSVASSDSDSENIYNIPSRMPLRVVNPDPEDSEEEEQPQQHQENKEKESVKPLNNNINNISSENNTTVPETMAKQKDNKHATQVISPLSNPIEQQNKINISNNDNNENNSNTTTTTTTTIKPSIVRRQSKTLDETSHSSLLPPVDKTPFSSTHFTGTTSYTSQYDLNTATDTHKDPITTTTTTTTTTSNVKKRSSSLPKNNNEPLSLSPTSISNTSFNQQQQNILSPIAESTTQPELLLQSIDSNQMNLTFNHPLFSSTINNDNDNSNRSSIDYLNSPHPSHVGSTSYAKYTTQSSSKYTKASYSLTNNPGSLRLYRDMAKKTRDKSVQFTYACYLLEIADLYDQGKELKHNKLTSIKHSLSEASQRLRQEIGQTTTRYSIDTLSSSSSRYQQQSSGFKKNSLPSSPRPSISNSIAGRSSFQSTGGYQIPSMPLSPTATTVDTYITNSTFPIASPSPSSPSSTSSTFHHHHQQPQPYQTFNFENNNNDEKNSNSNSHRRKKRVLEEEGIHWMKKLAKENVPEATFMLASWMDQSLYGFSPNPTKTFTLYDIAAKAGNQEAVYRIGLYYESINEYKKAYQCIKQASDMGITQATLKLFKIHLHGGLKQRQNMTLAISILYKATLDTDESNPEPFYLFGLILSNTYPHADIPSEVVEQYGGELNCLPYFEKAVQQGYPPAHSALGYILEHGLYGVRVNYAKSYIHYAESSKKGDPRGMVGLSRLNNKGSNGPDDDMDFQLRMNRDESGWLVQREPNEENAFYWCEKAAVEHELDEAEFLLGWYYEIGLGVPRDYAKAQWYYKKAASKGNDHALKRLLLQDNSVSKQQHDFIGNAKKTITTTNTTMDGLSPTKTKGKDSQQCYIM